MPDLLPSSPIPSPVSFPLPPPTSPVILKPLNVLHGPKDGTFLERPDHLAGRHVCIVLYATGDSREDCQRAWQDKMRDGVDFTDLGRAAKVIENAGYNWRELTTYDDVLAAAESLRIRRASQ